MSWLQASAAGSKCGFEKAALFGDVKRHHVYGNGFVITGCSVQVVENPADG